MIKYINMPHINSLFLFPPILPIIPLCSLITEGWQPRSQQARKNGAMVEIVTSSLPNSDGCSFMFLRLIKESTWKTFQRIWRYFNRTRINKMEEQKGDCQKYPMPTVPHFASLC
eukprot:GFUD01131014.1.p1 GENE.GFUD01131014.1~~GFUD01131014.1.p1  ORF type:complete len:114 (+),score=9.69 GFUD01131014.1:54-395(+)